MAITPRHSGHHQGLGHDRRREVVHTWVRAGEAELIAHLHLPIDGTARGVVLLCDGLMREQITGFRTYVLLADELAQRGILAIRFAWSGTSDSSSVDEADERTIVERYLADLDHMVRFAQEAAPGAPLTLFGLRGAAVFTAEYARLHPGEVQQLLWWEPVGSTRAWLRGQETLHKLSSEYGERVVIPELPAGAVEVPGHLFPVRDVAALKALKMSDVGGARVDAVIRPDLSMDRTLKAVLADAASVRRIGGQAETLDVSTMLAVVSRDTVDALAGAAEQVALADGVPLLLPEPRHTATVAQVMVRGRREPVVEHIVDADGVHAIVTDAVGEPTRAVMALGASSDPKAGPTFLWTEVNRRLAARGTTSIRADRCRVGEQIDPGDLSDPWAYRASAVEDVEIAYRWFCRATRLPVTMYALCSGAWIGMHVAATVKVPTIIAINHIGWDVDALPEGNALPMGPVPGSISEGVGHAPATRRGRLKAEARTRLKAHTPYPAWRWLARRGKVQMPLVQFERATANGTVVHQVLCDNDIRYARQQQLDATIRELALRNRGITFTRRLDMDHSLLSESSRRQVVTDILALVNRTPPSAAPRGLPAAATDLSTAPSLERTP